MARPLKVSTNNTQDYNETIQHKLLMCTNANGNNNKFYSIEMQKNPNNNFQIFSHYGRINGSNISGGVYEIRPFGNSESSALKEFNRIIRSKKRGKKRVKDNQTYMESYSEVGVISSSVGSSNVQKSVGTIKNKINNDVFKSYNKTEKELLIKLEQENVHDILSQTSIQYTGGALQTPLGPLTFEHIEKAKARLDKINDAVSNNKSVDELKSLNNDYLSLIPRNMGHKISNSSLILDVNKVMQEYDLINQMKTAINLSIQKNTDKQDQSLGFELNLADAAVTKEIIRNFESSRKHANLSRYKIKNVYEIYNEKERSKYEKKADFFLNNKRKSGGHSKFDYKEIDMFHGSRNSNILSILMNGFYVPPRTAKHVTGRMFGDGVYGADSSTKALNYSAGYWGGRTNKFNNVFCFVTRFAMGKVYETQHSKTSGAPAGYDSIYAKGGADLKNNEYIVSNSDQATMTYLIELA